MVVKSLRIFSIIIFNIILILCIRETYTIDEMSIGIADLLGLPASLKFDKKPLSLRKAASEILVELYNTFNENNDPELAALRNRGKRSNLISIDDRIDIEKFNNIITFSGKKCDSQYINNDTLMAITFNTNYMPDDLKLIRAELRLFQNPKLGELFEYEKNVIVSVFDKKTMKLKLLNNITTATKYKGWLVVDVSEAVARWNGHAISEHDLIISTKFADADTGKVTPGNIGFVNTTVMEEYHHPFVIGYFNGPELFNKIQRMRKKRELDINAKYTSKDTGRPTLARMYSYSGEINMLQKACDRMNFSVDFIDLEMQDWVIAPKKFEAYYCGGECNFPLGSKLNATNHAIVQTLMHLKEPQLPKPCCVPLQLESLSVLHYVNEDSVNLSTYPNIVAKSCGCH